ncbi:MAG: prepilin peptidase [Alphaproteobacteria bacterium]|nr:prepilin peptidase [Alphaproteobacteria bacterium]
MPDMEVGVTCLLYGFGLGFVVPFVARRLGKILPATTGTILYNLCHFVRMPNPHNPLQSALLRRKWQKLFLNATLWGVICASLFFLAHTLLPSQLFIYAEVFVWLMLCAIETDRRHLLLPDCLTIPLLLFGFLFATQTQTITPLQSIVGALFGYIVTTLSVFVVNFSKHNLFGGGDTKLAIALGAWLGMQGLNYSIFLSFFLFFLDSCLRKKRMGPYGPAIGVAALICFFILYAK